MLKDGSLKKPQKRMGTLAPSSRKLKPSATEDTKSSIPCSTHRDMAKKKANFGEDTHASTSIPKMITSREKPTALFTTKPMEKPSDHSENQPPKTSYITKVNNPKTSTAAEDIPMKTSVVKSATTRNQHSSGPGPPPDVASGSRLLVALQNLPSSFLKHPLTIC